MELTLESTSALSASRNSDPQLEPGPHLLVGGRDLLKLATISHLACQIYGKVLA
jgi:hypothetical protein